jgi:hypothetical protein
MIPHILLPRCLRATSHLLSSVCPLSHSSDLQLESAPVRKLLASLALVAIACGKRGDPKPPVPVIPQATTDLVVTQRADKVILAWSYPSVTTTGRSLTDIRNITVYRYVEQLPVAPGGRDPNTLLPGDIDPTLPAPVALFSKVPQLTPVQFVKLSTKTDSMDKASLADATAGAKLIYDDSPPFHGPDGRPVRLTYAVITEGKEAKSAVSNLAVIVPLPVALAPSALTATARPEGVTLSWTAPSEAVGGGVPILAGYNIYRTAPGEVLGELAAPVNAAPVTGTTFKDAPPYGTYDYRVTAVAATGTPLVQSDPSAVANVVFKDLVAPPAPSNVTTLIETNAVRLIWDPVDAPDLAGYKVYRGEGVGHEADIKDLGFNPLITTPITATTFIDSTVNLGIAFRYAVTSVDKNGNESPKNFTQWVVAPKTP